MFDRILVIRGGAIGDFVLTLPAIRLIREAFPKAQVEILGRHHIIQLAEGRYYAEKSRDIDSASLAGFFCPNANLDSAWSYYFSKFQLIISYLYDPDEIFIRNLYRADAQRIIQGTPKIKPVAHAALQLAHPLESLGLFLKDPAASLFPSEADKQSACRLLETKGISNESPFVVLHPGSGGKRKTWPSTSWEKFCHSFLQNFLEIPILCVGGESDILALDFLRSQLRSPRLTFLDNPPLPVLAALLSKAHAYVGHDTGISHIAAAAGAPCLLLYGPTDPEVWAPANQAVHVLTSPTGLMEDLSIEAVFGAFEYFLTTYAGNRNGFSH